MAVYARLRSDGNRATVASPGTCAGSSSDTCGPLCLSENSFDIREMEMAGREIRAKDIVEDIRAGLSDTALMKKYKVSPKGLQNLFDELAYLGFLGEGEHREIKPAKRRISAHQIVDDIRSGMAPSELMKKHNLSEKGLRSAEKKLVTAGLIREEELPVGLSAGDSDVFDNLREYERSYLDFDLPIFDVGPTEVEGKVRDITESGLGVVGIPAKVGETKVFLILHEKFFLIRPFLFEAKCCWAKESEEDGEFTAGFQITNTSEDDMEQLRKLIRIVRLFG